MEEKGEAIMKDDQAFWELKGTKALHLYAQDSWHMEAFIVGNQEGLIALRDAIDEALQSKKGQAVAHAFPTDGEGYEAHIICIGEDEEEKFHHLQLPYTGKSFKGDIVFDDEEVNIYPPETLLKFSTDV